MCLPSRFYPRLTSTEPTSSSALSGPECQQWMSSENLNKVINILFYFFSKLMWLYFFRVKFSKTEISVHYLGHNWVPTVLSIIKTWNVKVLTYLSIAETEYNCHQESLQSNRTLFKYSYRNRCQWDYPVNNKCKWIIMVYLKNMEQMRFTIFFFNCCEFRTGNQKPQPSNSTCLF